MSCLPGELIHVVLDSENITEAGNERGALLSLSSLASYIYYCSSCPPIHPTDDANQFNLRGDPDHNRLTCGSKFDSSVHIVLLCGNQTY